VVQLGLLVGLVNGSLLLFDYLLLLLNHSQIVLKTLLQRLAVAFFSKLTRTAHSQQLYNFIVKLSVQVSGTPNSIRCHPLLSFAKVDNRHKFKLETTTQVAIILAYSIYLDQA